MTARSSTERAAAAAGAPVWASDIVLIPHTHTQAHMHAHTYAREHECMRMHMHSVKHSRDTHGHTFRD